MKMTKVTSYCDKCSRTDETTSTNVPYLGWVFIDSHRHGVVAGERFILDLCPQCALSVIEFVRVWQHHEG